jgi:hypothetical protein
MTEIEKTLAERGQNYGRFEDHARIARSLKTVMRHTRVWTKLAPFQQEALDMIVHKIARILNGNPDYVDSWVDIAGYSTLVADILEKPQGFYYVYPDGSFYSADETTADELILNGHSDDFILVPLPLGKDGDPYIPDGFWDDPGIQRYREIPQRAQC